MKLNHIILLSVALASQSSYAVDWMIDGHSFKVDTLMHATTGPGTTETELRLTGTIDSKTYTHNVFYTTVDITNPYIEMRGAKGGDKMRELETVPNIGRRMDKPGERYFTGVNADFFNPGYPYNSIGLSVCNGSLTNYEAEGADIDPYYLVINEEGRPGLFRHVNRAWFGTVRYPDGTSATCKINDIRDTNDLVLYTHQWHRYDMLPGYTGTNQYGSEVVLMPVSGRAIYGNDIEFKVIGTPTKLGQPGNIAIPEGCYVLSGHGTAVKAVEALKEGDIVKARWDFSADGTPTSAREVLGGFPIIISNGAHQEVPSYPGHLVNREPRTAVGYNADRTRLFMVVVDGRGAGGSDGVTMPQLMSLMDNIGCYEAMNFDGGGSTTMYNSRLGVRNVPSTSSIDKDRPEGTPRPVVNALFAVAVAPEDNEIASIEIKEKRIDLTTGQKRAVTIFGYNRYGVLVNHDVSGYTLSVPGKVAAIKGHELVGAEGHCQGALTVTYGNLSHSIPVFLNGGGQYVSAITDVIYNDTVAPVYYNLQGIPVDSPQPGQIYIESRGQGSGKLIRF